jgi:hypothetical protein
MNDRKLGWLGLVLVSLTLVETPQRSCARRAARPSALYR